MNADDRAPAGPGQSPFTPVTGDPAARRPGVAPATGQPPVAPAPQQPPAAPAPTFGAGQQVPQRTAFRTGTQPQGAPQQAMQQPGVQQPGLQPRPAGQPGQQAPVQQGPGQPAPAQRQSAFAGVGAPAGAGAAAAPGTIAPGTTVGSPFPQTAAPGSTQVPVRSATGSVTTGKGSKRSRELDTTVSGAPRKVRVLLSRLDPLSALKIGFLLSIAAGIMTVVAAHILWTVLNDMEVFVMVEDWVKKLFTGEKTVDILQFVAYEKVMSATVLIAVLNTVLISGLAVLTTLIYNAISRVVGGVYLTLTDD